MTHIVASLPQEYSTVVDHAKIDWRNKALTLNELKKRLKEKYMQLRKKMDGLKMKWLLQQAKTVLRTKIKVQIKEKPQGLKEDVATVVSTDIRK